ncbi:MAG: flagellar hook-length control protein FliK [Desulfobulbaceae bacterium]|nr:flagellar hook-length control protein FliK [Desulfobulbaceae bacterium]
MHAAEIITPEITASNKISPAKNKNISLDGTEDNNFHRSLNNTIQKGQFDKQKQQLESANTAEQQKINDKKTQSDPNNQPDSVQLIALMNSVLSGRPINLSLLPQSNESTNLSTENRSTEQTPPLNPSLNPQDELQNNSLKSRENLLLQGLRDLFNKVNSDSDFVQKTAGSIKQSVDPILTKPESHPASLAIQELQKLLSNEIKAPSVNHSSSSTNISEPKSNAILQKEIASTPQRQEILLAKLASFIEEPVNFSIENGTTKVSIAPQPEKIPFNFNQSQSGTRVDLSDKIILSNLPSGVETEKDNNPATDNKGQQGSNNPNNTQETAKSSLLFNTEQSENTTTSFLSPLSGIDKTDSIIKLPSGVTVSEHHIINQVAARITTNKSNNSSQLTLRLQPEELGELKLEIRMERDSIKAHIIAQNPHVQDILERNLPRLREALEQNGLHLEHIEVSVAADNNSNEGFFKENNLQRQLHKPENMTNLINNSDDFNEPITTASSTLQPSLHGNSLSVHI